MGIITKILLAVYNWVFKDGILLAISRTGIIIKVVIVTPFVKSKEYLIKKVKYFLDFKSRRSDKKKRNKILKNMYREVRKRNFKRNEVRLNKLRRSIVIKTNTGFIIRLKWKDEWKPLYNHTYQPKFNPLPSNQTSYLLDLLDGNIGFLFRRNVMSQLFDKEVSIVRNVQKHVREKRNYRKSALISLRKIYYDNL